LFGDGGVEYRLRNVLRAGIGPAPTSKTFRVSPRESRDGREDKHDVRTSVIAILLSAVLGGSGVALQLPPFQRAQELLTGIFQDVEAIYASFAGGPNDPHSPVVDRRALEQDRGHLNDASNKAEQLTIELAKLREAANVKAPDGR
jgi:hypothetical protein